MMKIILTIFTIMIAIQFITAQSIVNKNLFTLYDTQKFEELKSKIGTLDKNQNKSLEIEFLKTLFMENGEEALQVYLKLFDKSYGDLKSIVAKKLSDYYYAKGYYLTASKYQKYLVENTSTKPTQHKNVNIPADTKKYIIQLGAFGLKENAVQLLEMLQTQNLFTRIENRNINGKTLHCVWLDGKKGFSETLEFAEKIKEKYHLQYRILQQ